MYMYVIQTLATVLKTYILYKGLPLDHCGVVAKANTEKYPILRDDKGDGEVGMEQ